MLTPSKELNLLLLYVAAVCAERYGVKLFFVMGMAHHYHLIAQDPRGRICDFCRDLDATLARSLNSKYGRHEALWSSQGVSRVEIHTEQDLMEKLVYLGLNPMTAHLVEKLEDWPGVWTRSEEILQGEVKLERPDMPYFSRSSWPKKVTMRLEVPELLGHLGKGAYVKRLFGRIEEGAKQLSHHRKAEGKRVLGAKRVMAQSIYGTPKKPHKGRSMDPQLACKDKSLRIALLKDLRQFREDYREAKARWLAGLKDVLFPAGTQLMERLVGARCEIRPPGLVFQGV